jgi:hypothetical protein
VTAARQGSTCSESKDHQGRLEKEKVLQKWKTDVLIYKVSPAGPPSYRKSRIDLSQGVALW